MKSKSRTRFSAATPTTITLKTIPNVPLEWIIGMLEPKKLITKLIR